MENKDIGFDKTDTVAGVLEINMEREVKVNEKYKILLFLWNEKEKYAKDYVIDVPILPIEEIFIQIKECVLKELECIIFGEIKDS